MTTFVPEFPGLKSYIHNTEYAKRTFLSITQHSGKLQEPDFVLTGVLGLEQHYIEIYIAP